jgi:hypothetical protein
MLRVIDTSTHLQTSGVLANGQFSDMRLTSDGQYLYAADYGGSETLYQPPPNPNYVRRYRLADNTWETRLAPTIAYKIEPVNAGQFAMLSSQGYLTLNTWGPTITETYRSSGTAFTQGDIEYHTATQRVLDAHSYSSGVTAYKVLVGDTLQQQDSGSYTSGDTAVLSTDGGNFYFGKRQIDALNCANGRLLFSESIFAASADLAFGKNGYYDAATGIKLGSLGFPTMAFALDAAGTHLWAFDPATDLLHHYLIVPEPTSVIIAISGAGCWLSRRLKQKYLG